MGKGSAFSDDASALVLGMLHSSRVKIDKRLLWRLYRAVASSVAPLRMVYETARYFLSNAIVKAAG